MYFFINEGTKKNYISDKNCKINNSLLLIKSANKKPEPKFPSIVLISPAHNSNELEIEFL